MPRPFSFGKIELDVSAGREAAGAPEPETPFRIVILGDFTGRANRGIFQPGDRLADRRPVPIDRDNFDAVLGKLGPALQLGSRIALRFGELDDFHPDRIYQGLEVFRRLRETRERLADPATFHAAAAEIGLRTPAAAAPAPLAGPPEVSRLASGSFLDQMIEETESRKAGARPADEWTAYLRGIMAPYVTPRPDPKQKEVIAQADAAIGGLMRVILHHPAFQALEAAWRAVFFLVRRLETGERLKLCLIDVSKAELAADLRSSEALEQTGAWRLLVEETAGTPGAEPWSLIVGNYSFEQTQGDAELLGRMAKIASRAGAPLMAEAGAQPSEEEGEQAWDSLRGLPEACWVGLALPRFLLRLPYGKQTDPIETFDFEEIPEKPQHTAYLWGNPAFACACLMGRAFSERGWEFRPGMIQEIEDLPAHVYQENGETRMKPCAELLLTLEAAEQILEMGLMPLLSLKNRDAARLARFQSLARPERPLAGRWA